MRDVTPLPPIRSWLYAPGNNPKLLERVFTTDADAVILDLEDAVPPGEKGRAREMVAATIERRNGVPGPLLFVRVNHPETGLAGDDIRAVVRPGLDGVRLPKTDAAGTVQQVSAWMDDAEASAGLALGSRPIVCSLETARGIWNALEIAQADPRLVGIGFGAVDFERDVNARADADGLATLYARSRMVLAARITGIWPPIESVYPHLHDEAGLEASTRQARALGFFGRAAIHPRQLPIVNAIFTPSLVELERAREIVEAAASAEATGTGAFQLADGTFVDAPVVQRAESLIRLAEALAARDASRET